ncbi:MAG: DUF1573 domain-containing protein [Cryomorphaceae bacterium]|nr:DUF1573 domain-containing protein [Cryomorphaceae bacterium]
MNIRLNQYLFGCIAIIGVFLFSGCGEDEERSSIMADIDHVVEVEVEELNFEDPYRKYYPIVQGEKLNITVKMKNVTDKPIRIFNVLTSCGCIVAKYPKVIAANSFGNIQMEYNSNKNLGHVEFHTMVIANTRKRHHEIYFETNVVPDELVIRDYEYLYYQEKNDEKSGIQDLVDGGSNERGYIIDDTEERRFKDK